MIPAYGMVFLPHNPSTENGQIPGSSFNLSVGASCVDASPEHVPELREAHGSQLLLAQVAGPVCRVGGAPGVRVLSDAARNCPSYLVLLTLA